MGDWEGRSFAELQRDHPEHFEGWLTGRPDFRFPNGERFAEVCERLETHLHQHQPQDGETLVLVT